MQVCSSSRRGAQLIDMDAEGRGTKGRKVKGKMGDEVFTRQVGGPALFSVRPESCGPD